MPQLEHLALYDAAEEGVYKDDHLSEVGLMQELLYRANQLEICDSYGATSAWGWAHLLVTFNQCSRGKKELSKLCGEACFYNLSVVDLPAQEQGLQQIWLQPPCFLKGPVDFEEVEGRFFDQLSTITSTGYLAKPHLDFYGVPSLIIHVFGIKVWLIWPATDKNFEAIGKNLINPVQHTKLTITVALSKLKGLKIVHCNQPGQTFVMEPFAIHTVISQAICGHHGKTFTNISRFNDFL